MGGKIKIWKRVSYPITHNNLCDESAGPPVHGPDSRLQETRFYLVSPPLIARADAQLSHSGG